MKRPDASSSALQRFAERLRECDGDLSTLMRQLRQSLAGSDEMQKRETAGWIEDFDEAVKEAVRLRRERPFRAPAAKPTPAREATEEEWKKLESELEQELIRKFNL